MIKEIQMETKQRSSKWTTDLERKQEESDEMESYQR